MSAPSTHPDILPFPAPSTFSILPDIYLLIARLNLLHQQPNSQSQLTNGHLTQPTQSTATLQNGSSQSAQIPPSMLKDLPLLDTKDLPAQIYPLKQKLAKARASVSELPDVERTVEEQDVEIRRLDAMVKAFKGRLGTLAEIATNSGGVDVEMGDGGDEG